MIRIFGDTPTLQILFPNAPKDVDAFERGDGLCYAPEEGDVVYTRADFLNLVDGNEQLARKLFEMVTWEHPETILAQDGDTAPVQWPDGSVTDLEFPGIGDYLERSRLETATAA